MEKTVGQRVEIVKREIRVVVSGFSTESNLREGSDDRQVADRQRTEESRN